MSSVIVSRTHKALVLKDADPSRVSTVIPDAKVIQHQGLELVAVAHDVEHVRHLRALGIEAPSPIEYHYEWSGQYTPFYAQRTTAAFLTLHDRAFVLSGLGTGKTLATLWAYDYLRASGKVNKALIICPISTMERAWADEIFRHFPHLTWAVLYGNKDRRLKLLKEDADVYIINHDGIRIIEKELIEHDGIDCIVIDELAVFRNAQTSRWRCMDRIVRSKYAKSPHLKVWGLTGTPTPNAPTDAYGQAKLLVPDRVPRFFSIFKDQVMKQISPFKWIPRPNATEIVADVLQPSIRFAREDCIDLPETIYQTRHAELTDDQQKAYDEMLAHLKLEMDEGDVIAVNEAVKLMKLVQIGTGVVYSSEGEDVLIPAIPRIEVVKEIIDEAAAKVIVFVPFRGSLRHVVEELAKDFTVESISGSTPKSARDKIFKAFQDDPDPRVLVAQPAAMSHGLTLTAANTIIWYAPITSAEIYEQANARIVRPGQTRGTLIVHIESTPVERKIYQRLKDKQKLQGLLLEIIHDT